MNQLPNRAKLLELAGENHGLFTLALAAAAGVPRVEVHKLAARGAFERVGKGVYRVDLFPATKESVALEAVWTVSDNAALFGESVLSLLGVGKFNPPRHLVATGQRVQHRLPANVTLVRREIAPVENQLGVPCQPVTLALMEASKSATKADIQQAAQQLLALGLISGGEAKAIQIGSL